MAAHDAGSERQALGQQIALTLITVALMAVAGFVALSPAMGPGPDVSAPAGGTSAPLRATATGGVEETIVLVSTRADAEALEARLAEVNVPPRTARVVVDGTPDTERILRLLNESASPGVRLIDHRSQYTAKQGAETIDTTHSTASGVASGAESAPRAPEVIPHTVCIAASDEQAHMVRRAEDGANQIRHVGGLPPVTYTVMLGEKLFAGYLPEQVPGGPDSVVVDLRGP
jgi:hypothetical protein